MYLQNLLYQYTTSIDQYVWPVQFGSYDFYESLVDVHE